MLGSLFGFFLPELINALWTKNRTAYWLLFIGSMISFMLFIILASQYVDRWHNIDKKGVKKKKKTERKAIEYPKKEM